MTLALDSTGVLSANHVTGEAATVNLVGLTGQAIHFLANSLFYTKGFVAAYVGLDGQTRNLHPSQDFEFILLLPDVLTGNPVAAAIMFLNFQINGTITFGYQAVGGAFTLNVNDIMAKVAQLEYNPRMSYLSVDPSPAVLESDGETPLSLSTFATLSQALTLKPAGVQLSAVVKTLPPSAQMRSEGAGGVLGDGGENQIIPGVTYYLADDGTPIPADSLAQTYTVNSSGMILTATLVYHGTTYVKTNTWSGTSPSTSGQWIRQA
jgi:hypothetical protein